MESIRKTYHRIIEQNTVLPNEFFNIRKEVTPKAPLKVLYLTASLIYLLIAAVFVIFMVTQSAHNTTETMVSSTDVSGAGWECTMSSSATTEYFSYINISYPSIPNGGFESYTYLLGINEGETDCLVDLHGTDPCAHSVDYAITPKQTYFYVVANAIRNVVQSCGTVVYNQSVVYPCFNSIAAPLVIDAGQLTVQYVFQHNVEMMAIDSQRGMYYLANTTLNTQNCIYYKKSAATYSDILIGCYYGVSYLTNDNLYQIFVFNSSTKTFAKLDLTSSTTPHTLLPVATLPSTYQMKSFLAYSPSTTAVMIFCATDQGVVLIRSDGSNTLIYPTSSTSSITLISTSDQGNTLLVMNGITLVKLTATSVPSNVWTTQIVTRLDVSACGYSFVENSIFYCTQVYQQPTYFYYYQYYFAINATQIMMTYIDGEYLAIAAGWLTCGSNSVSYSPFLQDTSQLTYYCKENGLSWNIYPLSSTSYFTNYAAYNYINGAVNTYCTDALYDQVCDDVGAQAPFICIKNTGLPFFTVLSTSIANTHLLLSVILIVVGYSMTKVQRMQQKQDADDIVIEMDGKFENEGKVEEKIVEKKNQDDATNPMQQ